jgi:hypothetical protein
MNYSQQLLSRNILPPEICAAVRFLDHEWMYFPCEIPLIKDGITREAARSHLVSSTRPLPRYGKNVPRGAYVAD